MMHFDLFLITTHSGKSVKYLPSTFPPDNSFFRKLWHFPDTFAIYYKQVVFPRKYVWPLESFYHSTRLSDPNFVLSYKSWVNRLLWALNSLQLILRNKHALPCWVVLLIKGDMYLWIHPTFFHVIQLIHISWAIYISWYAFFLRKKKKHSAQLHAPSWVKRLQIIAQIFCLDFKPSSPSSHLGLLPFLMEILLSCHFNSWDLHLSGLFCMSPWVHWPHYTIPLYPLLSPWWV